MVFFPTMAFFPFTRPRRPSPLCCRGTAGFQRGVLRADARVVQARGDGVRLPWSDLGEGRFEGKNRVNLGVNIWYVLALYLSISISTYIYIYIMYIILNYIILYIYYIMLYFVYIILYILCIIFFLSYYIILHYITLISKYILLYWIKIYYIIILYIYHDISSV